jgi:hypothetical protein
MRRCSPVLRDTHERFFISNYQIYRTDHYPGRKGGTAIAVREGIVHNHVDLPPLILVEAIGVCILLASVYKSLGHIRSDASITELLSFRCKTTLAGHLNAKHPFWDSVV